jgi:hypothetical protein
MNKSFELNIGTHKIKVTPGENARFKDGEIMGTYKLSEAKQKKEPLTLTKEPGKIKIPGI